MIEIIVVLIIVGILAAIALPYLFRNVRESAGVQVLETLSSYKTTLEGCYEAHGTITPVAFYGTAPCTFTGLNLPTTDGIWAISITSGASPQSATSGSQVAPTGTYAAGTLTFTLIARDGADGITFTRNTDGTWSCSVGTNDSYTGLC